MLAGTEIEPFRNGLKIKKRYEFHKRLILCYGMARSKSQTKTKPANKKSSPKADLTERKICKQ